MKGFSDYIICNWDELQRELEREAFDVEAPLRGEWFKKWLVEQGYSEGTASSYLSNIKRLDNELFSVAMDGDFFKLLKDYLNSEEPERAYELLAEALILIDEESRKEDALMPKKALNDCRAAFVSYTKFLRILIKIVINEMMKEYEEDEDESIDQKDETVKAFLNYASNGALGGDAFKKWLVEEKGLSQNTAASYLSYINSLLDKRLFPDIVKTVAPKVSFYAALKKCMKEAPGRVFELLDRVQYAIKREQKSGNPVLSDKEYNDCYSAFRRYNEFVNLLLGTDNNNASLVDNLLDVFDDALDANGGKGDTNSLSFMVAGGVGRCFPPFTPSSNTLRKTFRGRLTSQDRLSGSDGKTLFSPRTAGKIFRKVGQNTVMSEWANKAIDNIIVLTDKGKYRFADVDMIWIAPGVKVTVVLTDGTEATMLTPTANGGVTEMKVYSIEGITIDHVDAIHNTLVEDADKLPGFGELTPILRKHMEQIKEEKKRKGDKRPVSAHEVAKATFEELLQSGRSLEELAELLKKDLEVLSGIELVLMEARENSKKSSH